MKGNQAIPYICSKFNKRNLHFKVLLFFMNCDIKCLSSVFIINNNLVSIMTIAHDSSFFIRDCNVK